MITYYNFTILGVFLQDNEQNKILIFNMDNFYDLSSNILNPYFFVQYPQRKIGDIFQT